MVPETYQLFLDCLIRILDAWRIWMDLEQFLCAKFNKLMCHRMLHHAAVHKCIEQYWTYGKMVPRYRKLGWRTEGKHTLHGAHKVLWAVVMFWAVDIIAGVVDTFRCEADMCWLVQNSSVAHTCHGFQSTNHYLCIISTVFQVSTYSSTFLSQLNSVVSLRCTGWYQTRCFAAVEGKIRADKGR